MPKFGFREKPVGLLSRGLSGCKNNEERIKQIKEAVNRYLVAKYPIPNEWINEWNNLTS